MNRIRHLVYYPPILSLIENIKVLIEDISYADVIDEVNGILNTVLRDPIRLYEDMEMCYDNIDLAYSIGRTTEGIVSLMEKIYEQRGKAEILDLYILDTDGYIYIDFHLPC